MRRWRDFVVGLGLLTVHTKETSEVGNQDLHTSWCQHWLYAQHLSVHWSSNPRPCWSPDAIRSPFTLGDDTMQFRCERLIVIAWRAKSKKTPVIMISSACLAGIMEVHNWKGDIVQKPDGVNTYKHLMNGVDRNDQHCTYYSFVLQQCSRPSSGHPRLGPTTIWLNRKLHLFDQRSSYHNCVVCNGQTRHTTGYYCKTVQNSQQFTLLLALNDSIP